VCTRCEEGERNCVLESKYRFRKVQYVDTSSQGVRSRTHLIYKDDQIWTPTKKAVGFILEDGAGAEYGTADFIERDERRDEAVVLYEPEASLVHHPTAPIVVPIDSQQISVDSPSHSTFDAANVEMDLIRDTPAPQTFGMLDSPEPRPLVESWQSPQEERRQSGAGTHSSGVTISDTFRGNTELSNTAEDYTSPASLADLSRRHESGRRLTWGTGEYGFLVAGDDHEGAPLPTSTAPTKLSHREAFLMQHFVQKLAPWMDCCDPAYHFAREVPRRAVRIPMVLYAVLAVSSRHQSLRTNCDAYEGTYYHGRCLELVICELSKPETSYDDNLFATMVCMRVYEELDDTSKTDKFLHLKGVGRLLCAIPTFAHSGGLAEAASWQALRQDIYVAIRDKIPPSLDLENYGLSRVFNFRDDAACANVVILIFGRILRLIYSPPGLTLSDAWKEIEHQVELWDAQSSRVFQPLFVKKANSDENQPFPILRLIHPAQGTHNIH
jgi:hypothetical protein